MMAMQEISPGQAGAGVVSRPKLRIRGGRRRRRQVALAFALIAPAIVWRTAVVIYPFVHTMLQAFTNESPMNPVTREVGLRNFSTMFSDPIITNTLEFTAIFTVASTALQLMYALAVGLLLNSIFPGRALVRAVNLLPWAMPAIVIATSSQWLFNSQYGMVDDLLVRILPLRPIWLADPTLARVAVVLLDVWKNAPWASIIILAGLQNIPGDLYEAARVDGASRWTYFHSVTVPLLSPLLITLGIFIATSRLLTFDIVYGFTQGGPGTATSLLSYQVYRVAFNGLYFGYASAIAVFGFVLVLVMSFVGFVLLRWSIRAT
jgi:multiple sugar transport system permease protein